MQTCSINGIRLPFLSSDSLPNIYTLSARFLLKSNNVNEVFFFITILYISAFVILAILLSAGTATLCNNATKTIESKYRSEEHTSELQSH